jgi:hypothetical protein
MKKLIKITLVTFLLSFFVVSCGGKTTSDCKGDVRAYEFGREMYSWVVMRSAGLSLEDAINEYSDGIGVNHPYESNHPCVMRGFNDSEEGVESPYNKEGKSWNTF